MARVQQPRFVEQGATRTPQAELQRASFEGPALAARAAAGREHVPEGDRGAVRQLDRGALVVASAGEARRRVGRHDQRGALRDLRGGVGFAPPLRTVDACGALGRDEGARAGAHRDAQPHAIAVDQPPSQRAGVDPGRAPVVPGGQKPQRALGVRVAQDCRDARALERQPAVSGSRHGAAFYRGSRCPARQASDATVPSSRGEPTTESSESCRLCEDLAKL